MDKKRINIISLSLLDKLIEFLRPLTFVMKRIQASMIPSIHTVTPSICVINSSLEVKQGDAKQDKGKEFLKSSRFYKFFLLFLKVFFFFRQRAKQILMEMIIFDPLHLMATFLNPKTRKMNHLSTKQREECIEYIKEEMLLVDVDHHVKLPSTKKIVSLLRSNSVNYMTDFYLNAESDDDDYINQQTSSKSSSHAMEIDLYIKHGSDKTTISTSSQQQGQEYNSLLFWKTKYISYPILTKVVARVFSVLATSAAVEREFSLAGNIITQKRAKLSPDTVNDIVFNNAFTKYICIISSSVTL